MVDVVKEKLLMTQGTGIVIGYVLVEAVCKHI